jgi:hypothetical protein
VSPAKDSIFIELNGHLYFVLTGKSIGGNMSELDLNELRRRVLQNQDQGSDSTQGNGGSVFVGPDGTIRMGGANDRGVRNESKLPPTVFAR